jgi:hypothetical protein
MNAKLSFIIKCSLLAGVVAAQPGCQSSKQTAGNFSEPEFVMNGPGAGVIEVIPPDGNSGSLTIQVNQLGGNPGSQQCFPSGAGWDKAFSLPKFFLGPNTTPTSNSYTNANNIPSVTVSTCDPANGTQLATGIVIVKSINPLDKVCATNSSCIVSTKLTMNTRSMANNSKYIATVFYKSSTFGSLTSVKVNWSYP